MATKTDQQDEHATQQEFFKLVNMSASELTKWLATAESKSVGQTKDGANESIGHQSGKQIVGILENKGKGMSEEDMQEVKRVISYIKRHLAQRPDHIENSNWEYSLKNWGHDPTKK